MPGRPVGIPKTGGRKKGVPNKINSVARCAFLAVFENLRPDLEAWIRKGAATDPLRAADIVLRMAEYHYPKAKPPPIEVTGVNDEPLTIQIIKYGQEGI